MFTSTLIFQSALLLLGYVFVFPLSTSHNNSIGHKAYLYPFLCCNRSMTFAAGNKVLIFLPMEVFLLSLLLTSKQSLDPSPMLLAFSHTSNERLWNNQTVYRSLASLLRDRSVLIFLLFGGVKYRNYLLLKLMIIKPKQHE